MDKKRIIVFSIVGLAGLVILFLSLKTILYGPIRNQIPALPELQALTAPQLQQITYASGKAMRFPTADRLGFLGMVYHSSTYYEKAEHCYKLAVKKNSSKWIWNYYLGYLDKEMGKTDSAVENFNEVVRKDPGNNMALYYTGEGYQDKGMNSKAEEVFNKIISRPENANTPGSSTRKDYFSLRTYAMFQLARIFISTQRTDEAEKTLKEIILSQPAFGPAYRLLGNVYSLKGEPELSSKYITRANDLKNLTTPVDTLADRLARISRSELYILKQIDEAEKNGYPVWAIELIDQAIQHNPDNKYMISKAIKIFLLLDLPKMALPYLDKHMQYFGGDSSEMKMVADLFMKKGLYAQSQKYFTQALKLQPGDVNIQLSLILCLGHEDMKPQALELMNKLHEADPENLKVLSDGVYIMLMLGANEKAKAYLEDLRKRSPNDPKGQQLAAILLEQDGKIPEALAMYELSFKGNPDDLTTASHLCNLLLNMNKWDRALYYYREALKFHPNEPSLLDGLGTLLVLCPDVKVRNISEGREFAERAFYSKSSPARTIISAGRCLAEAYGAIGDNKNASNYLSVIIGMARREQAPREIIEDLEKRLEQYRK